MAARSPAALIALLRIGVLAVVIGVLPSLSGAKPAEAVYHLALVSEVMVGYEGDPDVQFIEVEMLSTGQQFVEDTRLTVWNADGSELEEILILDHDVQNEGAGVHWLMATEAFQDLTGLEPDFIISPAIPDPSGMFCWGGPDFPLPPDEWDPMFPFLYTDCVAYGGYSGGNSIHPPPLEIAPGDGTRALQRTFLVTQPGTGGPAHLSAPPDRESFELRCPSPDNNAGEMVLMGADDDGDGLPNCHEEEAGSDPDVTDSDGDGFDDREEWDAGSDPTDPDSDPVSLPTPTPMAEGGLFGDANGDSLVTAVDSALILQHTAGLFTLESILLADVDCSGNVTSLDSLLVLQFVGRLFGTPLPNCPPVGSFI